MEGNLRSKIDWASLIVGWKFTGFALFCVTSLRGLYLEGLIHGGAYFGNSTGYYIQNEGSAIAAC